MNQLGSPNLERTLLCVSNNKQFLHSYENTLRHQGGFKVNYLNAYPTCLETRQASQEADLIILDARLFDHKNSVNLSLLNCETLHTKPAIILDQDPESLCIDLCINSGIDDYLVHPLHPATLCLKLELLINSYKMLQTAEENNKKAEALLLTVEQSEALRQESNLASHIFYNYLLGKNEPPLPKGFRRHLNFCNDFGGDLILAQNTPDGKSIILHADATGHGLAATMTLIPITHVFRAMVAKGCRLETIIEEMNRALARQIPDDRFVAASLIEVNWSTQALYVWNGGMPSLRLLDGNRQPLATFTSKNPALGILENSQLPMAVDSFAYPKGASLIGISDGLSEQFDQAFSSPLGEQKALDLVLNQFSEQSNDKIKSYLLEFSGKEQPDDDISAFMLDLEEAEEVSLPFNPSLQIAEQRITPFQWSYFIYGKLIVERDIPSICYNLLSNTLQEPVLFHRVYQTITTLYQAIIDFSILNLRDDKFSMRGKEITQFIRRRNFLMRNLSDNTMLGIKIAMEQGEHTPLITLDFAHNGAPITEELLARSQFAKAINCCQQIQVKNQGSKLSCII